MPARPKINLLPEEIRKRLDAKLITGGFADYVPLAKWLASEGYEISKSAIHRHGQELERKLDAIRAATAGAKAIVDAAPDDEGAMNDALMRLVQEKIFSILVELENVEVKDVNLAALGRTIAQLGRASVNQKKWEQEIRAKIAAKVRAAGATLDGEEKRGGLSADAAAKIRAALLEVAA